MKEIKNNQLPVISDDTHKHYTKFSGGICNLKPYFMTNTKLLISHSGLKCNEIKLLVIKNLLISCQYICLIFFYHISNLFTRSSFV